MARYSIDVKYDKALTGNVTISTLLGAFKCFINYKDKKLTKIYAVFGIPLRKKVIEDETPIGNLSAEEDGVKETIITPETKEIWQEPELKAPSNYKRLENAKENEEIKEKGIFDKIKDGYHFLTDESNQRLINLVKTTILDLLSHLKPREMTGDFEFGFNSPYFTGKVLEIFALLYATMGDKLRVRPNWEKEMFIGEFRCSGKFSIFYVGHKLLKVWKDEDFVKWRKDHNG